MAVEDRRYRNLVAKRAPTAAIQIGTCGSAAADLRSMDDRAIQPHAAHKVQRLPDRGKYDRETVYRILDEGFVCHVGFVVDGQPFVIPTNYARVDETLYVHGSSASRMLRTLAGGVQMCVTVTLVDGLVLARSAFHHSANYRSVVMLGARDAGGR